MMDYSEVGQIRAYILHLFLPTELADEHLLLLSVKAEWEHSGRDIHIYFYAYHIQLFILSSGDICCELCIAEKANYSILMYGYDLAH
jgi:hypothetical protein